jgi:lysophospholipase L1-like esterase
VGRILAAAAQRRQAANASAAWEDSPTGWRSRDGSAGDDRASVIVGGRVGDRYDAAVETPAHDLERPTSSISDQRRYVALGDSYTIGTSVRTDERFPNQLVASMGPGGPRLRLVGNLGVNGYTSADLIRDELPAIDGFRPEFVTLLIGVNDVVRRVPLDAYEGNVETILEALLVRLAPDRIVTVAIPDYTVTPAGGDYGDAETNRAAIMAANDTMAGLSEARSIRFVDIVDISRRTPTEPGLVASDGLHPSGSQYARWVERIRPVVEALLRS